MVEANPDKFEAYQTLSGTDILNVNLIPSYSALFPLLGFPRPSYIYNYRPLLGIPHFVAYFIVLNYPSTT